ncbi:MAG: hypothetical protein JO148_16015 [Acidimicrobiia bacterium]|nr:hypothetical protein [Acidimicrobiia bacterium]
MTAVQTRQPEPELDLTPWQCPSCGYANEGIRGFCAGCRRQRPAPEPQPAVRRSTAPPPPTQPPAPPALPVSPPTFGPREVIATVLIAVMFVGGILTAIVRTTEHTSSLAKQAAKVPAASGSASATSWDPRVLDIVQFVERRRGLQFKHPVPMEFLDDAAFDKHVTSGGSTSASDEAELDNELANLRAVGLVEGSPNLQAAEDKLASNSILGLYSPEDKKLYVRGTNLTPDVRVVLAHELTHGLQDQYFGLDRLGGDSGEDTAFRALAEADAVRVEDSYADSLSSADAKAYEAARAKEEQQADVPDVPEAISDDLAFPYVFGPAFVAFLEDRGGNDAIDAAFKNPPQSEAQIIDPQSYVNGVKVTKVAAPALKAGQKRIEKAHDVGQVSMLEVLGSRLPYDQAWGAVKNWTGDQGMTYRENGNVCFASDTALKDPASADAFEAASRAWAATMPSASVTRMSPTLVEFRSCDPGAAYSHPMPQPSAFKTLSLRSELVAELAKAGLKYSVASCATDQVISQVGAPKLLDLDNVTDQNDPRIQQVQRATRLAVATCQRSTTT